MFKFENYEQSIIVSDLGAVCEPKENMSETRIKEKWAIVPYETVKTKGSMLVEYADSKVDSVRYKPGLKGWYGIFVGLPTVLVNGAYSLQAHLKLDSDKTYREFRYPSRWRRITEYFWKCADLTDETITIAKLNDGIPRAEGVCWFRFVPMTEAEINAYQAEQDRTDTRSMYSHYDMHDCYHGNGRYMLDDPLLYVDVLADSDVEWVALENHDDYDGEVLCGDIEKQQYGHPGYIHTHRWMKYNPQVYPVMIDRLHQLGRKVAMAHRIGAWAICFPFDNGQFRNRFWVNNKHLRCIDRDGQDIDQMSYAFKEVQDYMIDTVLHSASFHPDAIQLMYNRCPVALLFEQPVLNRFEKKYPGIDMRVLPLEDERVREVHCEIMTEFVRRLRNTLDDYCRERGWERIELHVRTMCTVYDTLLMGVDLHALAKEGLIDAILHYPRRTREKLPDCVFADASHDAIDIAKYSKFANEFNTGCSAESVIYFSDDEPFYPPWPDHKGVMHGPADLKESLEEFLEFEKQYGIPFYYELMPRNMSPDKYREVAKFAYDLGVNHLSIWDTNSRWPAADEWQMVSKLGHKEELDNIDTTSEVFSHQERVLNIGGIDYSRYVPCHGG